MSEGSDIGFLYSILDHIGSIFQIVKDKLAEFLPDGSDQMSENYPRYQLSVNELSINIENQSRRFTQMLEEYHSKFYSQEILGHFNTKTGVILFLIRLLKKLGESEYLSLFYVEVLIFDSFSIQTGFSKILNLTEDYEGSFYILGMMKELFNPKMGFKYKWEYWLAQTHSFKSIPYSWREDFKSLLMKPCFRNGYISEFGISESHFDVGINTAMFRVKITRMQEGLYGFTTPNLYIFIGVFLERNVLYKYAIFLTLVHELFHYFRRFRCSTIEEVRNITTPENSNYNSKEGGTIGENIIFGGRVKFLSEIGAKYLEEHKTQEFDMGFFQTLIDLNDKEIYERTGVVLKRSSSWRRNCLVGFRD